MVAELHREPALELVRLALRGAGLPLAGLRQSPVVVLAQELREPGIEHFLHLMVVEHEAASRGADEPGRALDGPRAAAQRRCQAVPCNSGLGILSIIDQQPASSREQMIGLVKAKQSTEVDH